MGLYVIAAQLSVRLTTNFRELSLYLILKTLKTWYGRSHSGQQSGTASEGSCLFTGDEIYVLSLGGAETEATKKRPRPKGELVPTELSSPALRSTNVRSVDVERTPSDFEAPADQTTRGKSNSIKIGYALLSADERAAVNEENSHAKRASRESMIFLSGQNLALP